MVGAGRRRVVCEDLRPTFGHGVGLGATQAHFATGEAGGQQVTDCRLQILFAVKDADGLANRGLEADG